MKTNLVEATILALQGKLNLDESDKQVRTRKTRVDEKINHRMPKKESLNVSVQDDGSTVVDTDDNTVIVQNRDVVPDVIPSETTPVITEIPVETEEITIEEQPVETEDTSSVEELDNEESMETIEEPIEESKNIKTESYVQDNPEEALQKIYTSYVDLGMEENFFEDIINSTSIKIEEIEKWYNEAFSDLIESKQIKKENKLKYNAASFTKVIENFYKENYKTIKEFKINKFLKNSNSIKIEGQLINKFGKTKDICLEAKQIQKGTSFTKYNISGLDIMKLESTSNNEFVMMTLNNKNLLECKYLKARQIIKNK